jgi:hypothetical protein
MRFTPSRTAIILQWAAGFGILAGTVYLATSMAGMLSQTDPWASGTTTRTFNLSGAGMVVVLTIASLFRFWRRRAHETREGAEERHHRDSTLRIEEPVSLTFVRRVSRWVAQAAFPISFVNLVDVAPAEKSVPPSSESPDENEAREKHDEDKEKEAKRLTKQNDNRVDAYVWFWSAVLVAMWTIGVIYEEVTHTTGLALTLGAWIAAYRVTEIVVSRIHILSTNT